MDSRFPVRLMFYPPQNVAHNFNTAVDAIKLQQAARITKAVLFAFATLAVTAIVVLAEASLIAWPIFLPAILVTIVAGALFYRLNSFDHHYIETLTDEMRSSLVRKELSDLFCTKVAGEIKKEEIERVLQNVNLLVGCEVFTGAFRKQLVDLHASCDKNYTLAEAAKEKGISLKLETKKEWNEQGRFGKSSYKRSADLKWEGKKGDPIEMACTYVEIIPEEKKEGE